MSDNWDILPSDERDSENVHQRLRAYNRQYMRGLRDYSHHIDIEGELAAGIVAGSVFDTLEVEFLFVEQRHRGKGLGRALLRHVEALAARDGLKRVILNTYGFQAPGFYRRMGYQQACAIEPYFGEYGQYWFVKAL